MEINKTGKGIPHVTIAKGPEPVPSGETTVTIERPGKVLGGYTVKLFSHGSTEAIAAGSGWIDWEKVGW